MAASFVALEKLFTKLVMAAIPDGTPTRMYCEASYLCIEVEMQPEGDFNRQTVTIFMQEAAINTYSRHNDAQRLAADARLTRYIHNQFAAFVAGRDHAQHHDHYVTEWPITDRVLNGPDASSPRMISNNSAGYTLHDIPQPPLSA